MTRLESLCYGIMMAERWAPGSRSWRNNNPGNLRSSYLAAGTRDGFAFFWSFELGWRALYFDLYLKCSGRSKSGVTPESSLNDFVRIYARPQNEEEHENYVNTIAKWVDAGGVTPMSFFLGDK